MTSILLVMFAVAGILLLLMANKILFKLITKKKVTFVVKGLSVFGIVFVNLIITYWLNGYIGRVAFLIPFILLSPTYFIDNKRKK